MHCLDREHQSLGTERTVHFLRDNEPDPFVLHFLAPILTLKVSWHLAPQSTVLNWEVAHWRSLGAPSEMTGLNS